MRLHLGKGDLVAYAGDYEHPAYGLMSIKEQGGALHWSCASAALRSCGSWPSSCAMLIARRPWS
jgi:hypothetical protein